MGNVEPIVCYPILASKTSKESLDIYRDIQEGAYVQRFYSTLGTNEKYYAIMEDLTGN